eukprot:SAG25_NODE_2679_length_1452_cov_3.999261_1_plen_43_part_10
MLIVHGFRHERVALLPSLAPASSWLLDERAGGGSPTALARAIS